MGVTGVPGMRGLLVARVYLFFKFSFAGVDYPCALVHWYTTVGTDPDSSTGLWVVEPEYTHGQYRNMGVIHLDSVVRGAHLLPRFPSTTQLPREINYTQTLNVYQSFYVNKYVDHHALSGVEKAPEWVKTEGEVCVAVPLDLTTKYMMCVGLSTSGEACDGLQANTQVASPSGSTEYSAS